MKELRPAILRMHSFSDSERTIAEALRILKTTVHRTIQRGTVEDRQGRGPGAAGQHPPRHPDRRVRLPEADQRDARGTDCQDRRRLRCQLHQRRLHRVATERAGQERLSRHDGREGLVGFGPVPAR